MGAKYSVALYINGCPHVYQAHVCVCGNKGRRDVRDYSAACFHGTITGCVTTESVACDQVSIGVHTQ